MMSNPILAGGVGSPQSIYEVYAPGGTGTHHGRHRIGTRAVLEDGRVFYYCAHTLSTTLTGISTSTECAILGQPAAVANHQNRTVTATAGQKTATIALGATAVSENDYSDGVLLIDSATLGAGQARKIKYHPTSAGSTTDTYTLYDAWNITATGTVTGSLMKNPFRDLVVFTGASQAATAIGVAQVLVGAGNTNTQYFWAQTQGWCPLSAEGSITVGAAVVPATATAADVGQVKAAVESGTAATVLDTYPLIGYVLLANGTDEHSVIVDLQIRG